MPQTSGVVFRKLTAHTRSLLVLASLNFQCPTSKVSKSLVPNTYLQAFRCLVSFEEALPRRAFLER